MNWIMVLALGALGVGSRYAVDLWVSKWNLVFPYGTLFINIAGCFIAGFVFNFHSTKPLAEDPIRLGLIVGFCGGFTTFSGFGLQFFQLLDVQEDLTAIAYLLIMPILCVVATGAGYLSARAFS